MLDRLEQVRELGHGAVGDVFEARHKDTGKRYVVKRMRPEVRQVVDAARFRREAELMRVLCHPSLMPVVHIALDSNPPCYVMPYREGQTLDARLREGKLSQLAVACIGRDVAFGLAEVHRLGIIHRDIKPANLFLERSGQTVILDFGLAKDLRADGALTMAGTTLGTPAYMAPEQIRGDKVDGSADIYSLGVTLFELVTGRNPFAAEDAIETFRRQLEEPAPRLGTVRPHNVPEEMAEIVSRMLAKVPWHRPRIETCLEAFDGLARSLEQKARLATVGVVRPGLPRNTGTGRCALA